MQLTTSIRSALIAGAAATILLTGATGAVAAPPAATAPAAATAHSPYGRLRPLAALSAERLATADLVARLLTVAADRVRHERQLDGLHTSALARSLRSVCGGN
ncbi:hypothetical protein [Streptomyces tubercidicus]